MARSGVTLETLEMPLAEKWTYTATGLDGPAFPGVVRVVDVASGDMLLELVGVE